MSSVQPVFLSTYPPEECGLATFTKDSADAVDRAAGKRISSVVAIQKIREIDSRDHRIVHVIDGPSPIAYREAARAVNDGPGTVVSLQHEFGLYSGEWGNSILKFIDTCTKPIVTTLHTLQARPEALPRQLIREIAFKSEALIVMTETAATLLRREYGVHHADIHVIPHGVPVVPFDRDDRHRTKLGLQGRKVICSFGLINPGKGLEYMIRAMPMIVRKCPEAIYSIVGVTHPQVKRDSGEVYRSQLTDLAASLGVSDSVQFVDQYLELPELISYLQASDVFVTPYLGKDQIASGTMAYAMGAVGAVVSTPYLFAEEVLADGRGQLVPFGSSEGLAEATIRYLTDSIMLRETRKRAYSYASQAFWPIVGKKYLDLFASVNEQKPVSRTVSRSSSPLAEYRLHGNLLRK